MTGLQQVADRTWAYVQGDGGWGLSNAGFVAGGDGEALLVDTFWDRAHTEALLAALPGRPSVVVNTHFNGDHCWGNELVADARIVAHAECRRQLEEGPQPAFLAALQQGDPGGDPTIAYLQRSFSRFDFSGITVVPPGEVFESGSYSLDVGGRAVELFHYGPAHTRGDVVAWVPDVRVLFAGDLLFYKVCPLIWDGTVTSWLAALEAMQALDPAVVVPGHGPVAGPEALEALAGYFRLVRDQGTMLHTDGVPLEEAVGRLQLGEYGGWVDIERTALNLLQVYRELDGETGEVPAIEAMARIAAAAPRLAGGCC